MIEQELRQDIIDFYEVAEIMEGELSREHIGSTETQPAGQRKGVNSACQVMKAPSND